MTVNERLQISRYSDWRHRLAAAVLGAMACGIVLGQQVGNPATLADPEEAEEIPRYKVELIVFEYNGSNAAETEIFAPDEVPVEDDLMTEFPQQELVYGDFVEVTQPEVIDTQTEADKEILPAPFTAEELILNEVPTLAHNGLKVLDPSEYMLNDIYDRLVALDAYTPLVRTAWSQNTIEEGQTVPIKLRRLGNSPLRLNGEITLYLSRYLHLVIDLALDEEATQSNPYDSTPHYDNDGEQPDFAFGEYQEYRSAPIHYRIEEDRIVRNGELRYYDHPKFGVLAKVTRVEVVKQEIGAVTMPIGSTDN
jgi:hypothetical protein